MSGVAAAQKPNKQKPRQVPQTDAEPAAPVTDAQAAGEALLEQMTSQSTEGLVALVHPDGMLSMDLEGRFMSVLVVKTNKDGSQEVSCETGREALAHAKGKAAPRAKTPAAAPATTAAREVK
jgi:hypothetical protein